METPRLDLQATPEDSDDTLPTMTTPTDRELEVGLHTQRLDDTLLRRRVNYRRAIVAGIKLKSVLDQTEIEFDGKPPIPMEMATKLDREPKKPMAARDSPSDGTTNDISEAKDTDVSTPEKPVNEADQMSDEPTTAEKSGGVDDTKMLDVRHPKNSAANETKTERPKSPAMLGDSEVKAANDKTAEPNLVPPVPTPGILQRLLFYSRTQPHRTINIQGLTFIDWASKTKKIMRTIFNDELAELSISEVDLTDVQPQAGGFGVVVPNWGRGKTWAWIKLDKGGGPYQWAVMAFPTESVRLVRYSDEHETAQGGELNADVILIVPNH